MWGRFEKVHNVDYGLLPSEFLIWFFNHDECLALRITSNFRYMLRYITLQLKPFCSFTMSNYLTGSAVLASTNTRYDYFNNLPRSAAWSSATNVVAVGSIAVFNYGLLMRSTNGGLTWTAIAVSTSTLWFICTFIPTSYSFLNHLFNYFPSYLF